MTRSSINRRLSLPLSFLYFRGLFRSSFFSSLRCAAQPRSPQNHDRLSRSHYRSRGNVNTCLATADLSGRIKNTISGREPGNVCLIELRRNHGVVIFTARRVSFRWLPGVKNEKSVPPALRLCALTSPPPPNKVARKLPGYQFQCCARCSACLVAYQFHFRSGDIGAYMYMHASAVFA